jgi:hypothetical protein
MIFVHTVISFISFIALKSVHQQNGSEGISNFFHFSFENDPYFCLTLFVAGASVFFFQAQEFREFPTVVPEFGRFEYKIQSSFVSSIVDGVN